MTETFTLEHLDAIDDEAKNSIHALAADAFGKGPNELTRGDILVLLELELQSFPSEITINTDEVRRTQLQFCTWRGGLSATVKFDHLPSLARRIVDKAENPVEGLMKASSMIRNFILSKISRTEHMLRMQMARTIKADGLEQIPNTRAAREIGG